MSLASPDLRDLRVDLYPRTYFPLFMTRASLLLIFYPLPFFTICFVVTEYQLQKYQLKWYICYFIKLNKLSPQLRIDNICQFQFKQINKQIRQMNSSEIIEYSISNFRQMCSDVSHRTRVITDYKSLIQKRLKIDIQYANKIVQFANSSQMNKKFVKPTKSSQIFFNCLVNMFKSQADNLDNYKLRLITQVSSLVNSRFIQLEAQAKKNINHGLAIQKQFLNEVVNMQKLKNKYIKRCSQIRKQKQQYIVGFLSDMPLYNKNKLYIKIKESEQKQLNPLQKEFTHNVGLFNQYTNIYAERMNKLIEKGSQVQENRVQTMKNAFMILQIAKSEYGANMVNQNNTLLTQMNDYEKGYPDFKKYSSQNYRQSKVQMLQKQIDPNKYINTLFSNIDTKLTENLILYGQAQKQKDALQKSLLGQEEFKKIQNTHIYEQIEQEQSWARDTHSIEEIGMCFKNIFDKEEIADYEKIKKLEKIMQNNFYARKSFVLCFQKFRWSGKYEISYGKIDQITQIINLFLDQCYQQKDTYNSKMIMILSLTYYVKKQGTKIDLYEYIRNHIIWTDKDWWECALLQSVYEHIKIKKKIENNGLITLWHIKGSYPKGQQNNQQVTCQEVVFNQLLYYITNMNLFGVEQQIIVEVIRKYIKYFNLSSNKVSDLQTCLNVNKSEDSFIAISNNENKIQSPSKKSNSSGSIKNLFS